MYRQAVATTQPRIQGKMEVPSLVVNLRKADHLLLSSSKVKNMCSCAGPHPPYTIMTYRETLPSISIKFTTVVLDNYNWKNAHSNIHK